MEKKLEKQFGTVLSMVLIVAMAIALVACGKKADEVVETTPTETVAEVAETAPTETEEVAETAPAETGEVAETEEVVETAPTENEAEAAETSAEIVTVGEGAVQFTFEVVDGTGATSYFAVNTDKATVGEALLDVDLIAGEDSEYGLYVKTVNGVTADYDVDQTYWAFYIDGEYAMTGVDQTDVVAGSTYSFKVEK